MLLGLCSPMAVIPRTLAELSVSFEADDARRQRVANAVSLASTTCGATDVQALAIPNEWNAYKFADFMACHKQLGRGEMDLQECKSFGQALCSGEPILPGKATIPPGSIYCEWLQEREEPNDNDTTSRLRRVIDRRVRSGWSTPQSDATVIHLRLGDVVDCANATVEEMLSHQTYYYATAGTERWNAYVKPLSYFEGHVPMSIPGGELVITSGTGHYDSASVSEGLGVDPSQCDPIKSCIYLHALQHALEALRHKVSLRVGHNPDEDTVFAASASNFIPSGGRYSSTLAELVILNGGHVEPPLDCRSSWTDVETICYLQENPDLKAQFCPTLPGCTMQQLNSARCHWMRAGMAQGRPAGCDPHH